MKPKIIYDDDRLDFEKLKAEVEHNFMMENSGVYAFTYRRDEFVNSFKEAYIKPIAEFLAKILTNG